MARERSIVSISSVRVRRSIKPIACSPYRSACLTHSPSMPSVLPPPRAPPKNTSKMGHSSKADCAGLPAPTRLLHNRFGQLRRRVFLHPFLFTQLRRHLDDVALRLLSLDFGSGFSVDSSPPEISADRKFRVLVDRYSSHGTVTAHKIHTMRAGRAHPGAARRLSARYFGPGRSGY